jgi:hypothetical protein
VLLTARDPSSSCAKQARDDVCKAYWRPVRSYLQSLGFDHGAAEDVTQNILAHFCNDGWIETVDRTRIRTASSIATSSPRTFSSDAMAR